MGIKYAEIKIALTDRVTKNGLILGGAGVRLKKLGYNKTALLFSLFCVLASFGTGNLTQIGMVASFFGSVGANGFLSAAVCCGFIGVAVFGGRERIAKINLFLVPFASAVYLLVCAYILVLNKSNIPLSFAKIFKEAFGFSSVLGGFSGAVISKVIREGFARSIFSNEAGMGSSPLAHSTSDGSAVLQAEWGIFEIFFDTFIVSTLTAICLLSGGYTEVLLMFSSVFGVGGKYAFGALSAVFAFASVISWCYYAECSVSFAFKRPKTPILIYRCLFLILSFFGVFASNQIVWELSDILNALMTFPNLFLLYKCRKEIERMV